MTLTSTATEIAMAVRTQRVSAREITAAALARLEAADRKLNIFTTVTAERALQEAAKVDEQIAAGRDPGPLAGVPYAVKNLFDLAGTVTVAGSKINREDPPAKYDATAVARLQGAGAVCLGAVNMGEYAYDFTTENTHYGPTRNPHDPERSPGGSSGGSAAAVAAGIVPLALGTDTNGSIRVPASFCGIWGLKPTYGRVSRAGAFLFVESLDHIGPFASSVADLAAAHEALQGPDVRDPVCSRRPADPVTDLHGGLERLRVAVLGGYFERGLSEDARAAVAQVAAALRADRTVELPTPDLARAAAYTITAAEGGHRHLARLRTRAADFDPKTRDRFLAGTLSPAAWALQAQKFRAQWRDRVREIFFREADILIAPATPVSASKIGQDMMTLDGHEVPLRPNLGVFTQPISFIGLPVVAAPVWLPGRMPIGVQLIGSPWSEPALLRAARVLESAGICRAPVAKLS